MTLFNPRPFYSHFLKGHKGKLHFAAHSHHFWPDVSRQAHIQYWDDCALLSDHKWEKIFSDIIPKTQKHIAKILNLKDHEQIVLAPNTHELSARVLSLFLGRSELKILTTSNEFYSWRRQFLRLQELPQIKIDESNAKNFPHDRMSFLQEMKLKLQSQDYDLVFLSQVFFDSGSALSDEEILALVDATPQKTIFVLDGYHGFAAIPCDLSRLEGRIFYLAGGYKYGQGGEGIGFMVVPKGNWRPAFTGWFAEFSQLGACPGELVGYSNQAMAFMGATQDPSGFYRFNAVWDLFESQQINVFSIHQYVLKLQKLFLQNLPQAFLESWELRPLFHAELSWHGHFLTFEAPNLKMAENCHQALEKHHILIDRRGRSLRFGFGLYHDEKDVIQLCLCLKDLAQKSQ